MVKHWINSTDKDSQNMFRKENKDGYSYYSKGFRAAANGDLLRQKTLGDGVVKERIVVPNSRVFDAIKETNLRLAYRKAAATKNLLKEKYANVTEKQCEEYITTAQLRQDRSHC